MKKITATVAALALALGVGFGTTIHVEEDSPFFVCTVHGNNNCGPVD